MRRKRKLVALYMAVILAVMNAAGMTNVSAAAYTGTDGYSYFKSCVEITNANFKTYCYNVTSGNTPANIPAVTARGYEGTDVGLTLEKSSRYYTAANGLTVFIPFTVEEEGTYDIQYYHNKVANYGCSVTNLYLDQLGDQNPTAVKTFNSITENTGWISLGEHPLTAGTHVVGAGADVKTSTSASSGGRLYSDCIKIKRTDVDPNQVKPTATAAITSSVTMQGRPITMNYTYIHADLPEGDSVISWYYSDAADMAEPALIEGENGESFTPGADMVGKYICAAVTPYAVKSDGSGQLAGDIAYSEAVGPVEAYADTPPVVSDVTFTNGISTSNDFFHEVGWTFVAQYTYSDQENDPDESVYTIYSADSAGADSWTAADSGTCEDGKVFYTPPDALLGKYIKLGITPKSGDITGQEVIASGGDGETVYGPLAQTKEKTVVMPGDSGFIETSGSSAWKDAGFDGILLNRPAYKMRANSATVNPSSNYVEYKPELTKSGFYNVYAGVVNATENFRIKDALSADYRWIDVSVSGTARLRSLGTFAFNAGEDNSLKLERNSTGSNATYVDAAIFEYIGPAATIKTAFAGIDTGDEEQVVLTGGKSVIPGEQVTLEAYVREGSSYQFSHWQDETGAVVSATPVFTVTAAENKTYTAVYQKAGTFSITVENGGSGIDGLNASAEKVNGITYGERVELAASIDPGVTGYIFDCWEINRKPVSSDANYSLTVTGDITVTAQFKPVDGTSYTVLFKDISGAVLQRQTVAPGQPASAPSVNPSKPGRIFTGWDKDFSNITSDLTVTARYEKDASSLYTVTANGAVIGKYPFDTRVSVTAETEKEGQPFYCWQRADGKIMSYQPVYEFFVSGDISLTAVYGKGQQKPAVSTDPNVIIHTAAQKMSFVSQITLPQNDTLIECGTLICRQDIDFTLTTQGVTKVTARTLTATNQFMASLTGVAPGSTRYARGYLIYKNASGNVITIYSDIVSGRMD